MAKRGPHPMTGFQHVGIGYPVPACKPKDFSRTPPGALRMAWQLCGPSVAENMRAGAPLWQVIAAAYYEGAAHAVGVMNDGTKNGTDGDGRIPYMPRNEAEELRGKRGGVVLPSPDAGSIEWRR